MTPQPAPDLLGRYLICGNPRESEEILSSLLREQAEPVVSRIVRGKVRGSEAEDVRHEILADLIERLREIKSTSSRVIRDFPGYAAVAAYHGCNEYFRRAFPQRYRLRNRLRYLLTKDPRFAPWESGEGETWCGRKEWALGPIHQRREKGEAVWASSREAVRAVEAVFDSAGRAIPFDELIESVGQMWGISDQTESEPAALASPEEPVSTTLERRDWLARVWMEIKKLPVSQRLALLLNFRDDQGGPALALFPVTGIASMRQIAATIEMPVEELASIWRDLPLDDQKIAERLRLNRQQVIGLRRTARERLGRAVS